MLPQPFLMDPEAQLESRLHEPSEEGLNITPTGIEAGLTPDGLVEAIIGLRLDDYHYSC